MCKQKIKKRKSPECGRKGSLVQHLDSLSMLVRALASACPSSKCPRRHTGEGSLRQLQHSAANAVAASAAAALVRRSPKPSRARDAGACSGVCLPALQVPPPKNAATWVRAASASSSAMLAAVSAMAAIARSWDSAGQDQRRYAAWKGPAGAKLHCPPLIARFQGKPSTGRGAAP